MQRNILIVDDEQDMLQLLKRSLAPDLNCRIETASSGKEALQAISRDPFDLVLADIKMPEMDGLALLETLRQRGAHTPVVLMSGEATIEAAVRAAYQRDYMQFGFRPWAAENG